MALVGVEDANWNLELPQLVHKSIQGQRQCWKQVESLVADLVVLVQLLALAAIDLRVMAVACSDV